MNTAIERMLSRFYYPFPMGDFLKHKQQNGLLINQFQQQSLQGVRQKIYR